MSPVDILKEVAAEVSLCTKCDLCKGRTKAVPGEGNPQAKILFIGEGPGFNEDKQGRPFVGPAGQFLEELLASINLKRSDVFITNVVKCRPPNNRDPEPGEIAACNDYLDRQIGRLFEEGVFATSVVFPTVAIDQARLRTIVTAAPTDEHLDRALAAFADVGRELGIISA